MFQRLRQKSTPEPTNEEQITITPDTSEIIRVMSAMLSRTSMEGVLHNALDYAVKILDGNARGFAILQHGQDEISAVYGYTRDLVGLKVRGPWANMSARILSDGSREFYDANTSEQHGYFDAAGMQDVPLTLVVPITDRNRAWGALVLDRTSNDGISPSQQELVSRWASSVAPLLGIISAREEWQNAARRITSAVVEAIESREFDNLGHARQVTDLSLQIGKSIQLNESELEELWFAGMLHDLGKVHGEQGHHLFGANFLHEVPHLREAQKGIRHHHENWDGTGEPDSLKGKDIPLHARIVAVANAYAHAGNLADVQSEAGVNLDEDLVNHLVGCLTEGQSEQDSQPESDL